jgi:hypothetical protein
MNNSKIPKTARRILVGIRISPEAYAVLKRRSENWGDGTISDYARHRLEYDLLRKHNKRNI